MKRHLLFALAMLFATVGFAQKDITSQYITNAKLDQGTVEVIDGKTTKTLTGWTVKNFNNSQQGNNTQGWASESYAGWGNLDITEYSLTQTIKLPAGSYRLVNYSFFRQGLGYDTEPNKSLAYLKAGDQQTVVKTLGSITELPSYANSQAEGANCFDSKMYRNVVEFVIAEDNTEIEIGLVGTFDLKQSWIICGMFELFDLNDLASVSSPTDVTYAIKNSGFEYRNLKEWTNNITEGNNQYSGGNNFNPKSGFGFYESWKNGEALGNAGTFTQTLANMPAGLYELSVYAQNIEQYNGNAGGTGMFLTANNDKAEIGAQGLYKVRTTLAQDGDLTVGISLEGCTGNWIAIDRFGLQFYGDPLVAYQDFLDEAVAEAQALVDGGTLNTAGASALQDVINANDNDDNAFTTEAEFNTAIENIEGAIATANQIATAYAAWGAVATKAAGTGYSAISSFTEAQTAAAEAATTANEIAAATAELSAAINNVDVYNALRPAIQALYDINEYEELETGAHENLGTALTASLDGITSAADIASINETLKSAGETYAANANPTNEAKPFDLTFMLINPDLEGLPTWKPADGWHTDQTDGNSQVMINDKATSEDGTKTAFYEYWSYTAKNNGEFTLYQEVTLPEGTFKMTCYAFAKQQDDPANTGDVVGIYFYANDTQGSPVSTDRLSYKEVEFVNTTEQNVKVGLKAINPNSYNWMGIGYVQLFKVPAKAFVIDEAVAYDNTQEGAGDVKLTRTIKAGMNTVVLPFQMTAADIEILGGEGAVARTVSEYLPASEDFSFAEVTEVAPNQPFFLYATVASADREDGNVYTFEGKTLVAGDPEAKIDDLFTLVGTYAVTAEVPVSTPEKRNFVLNSGKFYNVDSEGVSIHNTRCYIEINIPNIAINEGETFENTQTYKYANVTLTRTIKEGMNTVVVPFELTAEDIAAIGGEGAVAYTVSGYANDNLKFATAETVAANTPFFLNATEATNGAGEFAFEGKKVVAGDPIVEVSEDCSLVGTYEKIEVPASDDNGSYYILSGGKFYTVDSEGVTIKNTRFYVATSAPAGANTLGFTFDGEANAINGIIANDNAPEGIYNLQGKKVEKATKGIYIINGKKVLVK